MESFAPETANQDFITVSAPGRKGTLNQVVWNFLTNTREVSCPMRSLPLLPKGVVPQPRTILSFKPIGLSVTSTDHSWGRAGSPLRRRGQWPGGTGPELILSQPSSLRVFSTSHNPPGSAEETPATFISATAGALDNPGLVRGGGCWWAAGGQL